MYPYMYIDESGDLGEQTKYFVIAAITVKEPKRLDRLIRNMRRNKFKKELKKANEIHANSSSPELIKHALNKLCEMDGLKIGCIVLDKKKNFSPYLKRNKNKLYNFVAGKLAKNLILPDGPMEIKIDKSKGKQILRDDFNQYFEKILLEKNSAKKITIEHSYSHAWSGLQFADLVAWSFFQKFERKNDEYADIFKELSEEYHCW